MYSLWPSVSSNRTPCKRHKVYIVLEYIEFKCSSYLLPCNPKNKSLNIGVFTCEQSLVFGLELLFFGIYLLLQCPVELFFVSRIKNWRN